MAGVKWVWRVWPIKVSLESAHTDLVAATLTYSAIQTMLITFEDVACDDELDGCFFLFRPSFHFWCRLERGHEFFCPLGILSKILMKFID